MDGTVLIIEDNIEILNALTRSLRELGFRCESALDGEEGLRKALEFQYQLLLIDINLPKLDGMQICERVRSKQPSVPIIIVTSRSALQDKVDGLMLGADDYLVKPFSGKELAARVHALMRRVRSSQPAIPSALEFGDLRIDLQQHRATLKGNAVDLTTLELDLLIYLASQPGKLFSRSDLMKMLWGYESAEFGACITSYLSRIRSKIEENPKHPRFLQTVYGVGYRFTDPTAS